MKAISLLVVLLCISSCATLPTGDAWPDSIPPQAYFSAYYAQDPAHQQVSTEANYLKWIKRFYFGWELYGRGWLQATEELLDALDSPQAQASGRQLMADIGRLVSAEWAKDSRYRVINTRHISVWGNTLNDAIVKGEALLILERLLADVNALLNKDITPAAIRASRYYPDDVDDFFK
ncbi:MAG: hypothetical protein KTR20_08940 [Cellvibrionaceae bacterium]|nr:hypothetical protein [Cellvibrionaceae bacterium]